MARIALGVIGAAAGYFMGGPTGAAYGWAIGYGVGGIIFPEKGPELYGPRINDLRVQNSAYGASIPIVWGSCRLAGNIIWSTDLVEHKHTEEQGGKGGGGGTEVTTYTYTVSFAVSLCEGSADVLRIWADDLLIYNNSVSNTGRAQSDDFSGLAIYPGTETQMPNSTMEATLGVGNVPAYRGQCYVVFTDFLLTRFGNRIPNLTFEVVHGPKADQVDIITPPNTYGAGMTYNPILNEFWISDYFPSLGVYGISRVSAATGAIVGTIPSPVRATEGGLYDPATQQITYYTTGKKSLTFDAGTATYLATTDWSLKVMEDGQIAEGLLSACIEAGGAAGVSRLWSGFDGLTLPYPKYFANVNPVTGKILDSVYIGEWSAVAAVSDAQDSLWVLCNSPSGTGMTLFHVTRSLATEVLTLDPWGAGNNSGLIYDSHRHSLWLAFTNTIHEFSLDTQSVVHTYTTLPGFMTGTYGPNPAYDKYRQVLWYVSSYTRLVGINTADGSIYRDVDLTLYGFYDAYQVYVTDNSLWLYDANGTLVRLRFDLLTATNVTLANVVSEISERCSLTAGQIDVSELTDEVTGFMVTNQTQARVLLETLAVPYFFDGVESQGKIRFPKRNSAPVLTVTSDNLVAPEDNQ